MRSTWAMTLFFAFTQALRNMEDQKWIGITERENWCSLDKNTGSCKLANEDNENDEHKSDSNDDEKDFDQSDQSSDDSTLTNEELYFSQLIDIVFTQNVDENSDNQELTETEY